MKKKLLVVLGILVAATLILMATSLLFKTPGVAISQNFGVPTSFRSSTSYGANTMLFSNGRSFVTYNYVNGKTNLLSPDSTTEELKNVSSLSVSADHNYLVFHDEYATPGGVLATQLQQAGQDPTLDYWWVYSVQNHTFQFLPQSVLNAKMGGNTVYALSASNSKESLTAYNPSNMQQISLMSIPLSADFFPVNGGVLLQTSDNKILFTSNGTVSQQVMTSANVVGVTADQQWALAMTSMKGEHDLVSIKLDDRSTKTVANGVNGTPAWLSSGSAMYLSGSNGVAVYNLNTRKETEWRITGVSTTATFEPVALLGDSAAMVSEQNGSYQLVGNGLASVRTIPQSYTQAFPLSDGTTLSLKYDSSTQTFTAPLDGGNVSAEQQDVYNQIRSTGYNPYFFHVIFTTDQSQ